MAAKYTGWKFAEFLEVMEKRGFAVTLWLSREDAFVTLWFVDDEGNRYKCSILSAKENLFGDLVEDERP